MTVEQLNERYASLAAEYGLVVDSPYFDMDSFSKGWFTTNQYFDSPFYAIDYALSGCVAMQFLQMGLQDYGAALKTYEALVTRSADESFLERAGGGGARFPVCGGERWSRPPRRCGPSWRGTAALRRQMTVQPDADAA